METVVLTTELIEEDTSCHTKLSTGGECECTKFSLAPTEGKGFAVCAACRHTRQIHKIINYGTKR